MLKQLLEFFFPPADPDLVAFEKAMDDFAIAIAAYAISNCIALESRAELDKFVIDHMNKHPFIWPKALGPLPLELSIHSAATAISMTTNNSKLKNTIREDIILQMAASEIVELADNALTALCDAGNRTAVRYPGTVPRVNGAVSFLRGWKKTLERAKLTLSEGQLLIAAPTLPKDLLEDFRRSEERACNEAPNLHKQYLDKAAEQLDAMYEQARAS